MEITIKQVEDICKDLTKEVFNYFKMMEEHECLDRIDIREQFIMKMMPTVFKKRIFAKLKETSEKARKEKGK